jgi:molecular chaperone GrpE
MSQNPAQNSAESTSNSSPKWKELRQKSQQLDISVAPTQETTELPIDETLKTELESSATIESGVVSSPIVEQKAYEQLKAQNEALLEEKRQSQYIIAELHTSARRALEQAKRNVQAAIEKTIKKGVLSGLDALEMSIEQEGFSLKEKEGLQNVLQVFYKGLEDLGVKAINPKSGELFDPHCHSAISTEVLPHANQAANTVIRVLQQGYKLGEHIIRPAMVVVSRAHEER